MSANNTPTPRRDANRVFTFNWRLLWQRGYARAHQLLTSLRYQAGRTEYIPPVWMQRLRLSWFRIGLMLLALFVLTQKQVDFTISVGREGVAMGADRGRHMAAADTPPSDAPQRMSIVPLTGEDPVAAQASWSVKAFDPEAVSRYVRRFRDVAAVEEEKFNIPAPANMALAIYFSQAGQAAASQRDNNHFGPLTAGSYYDNAWMNWRAHSERINQRFSQLSAEAVNYQQWIAALSRTTYSTDAQLGNKLLEIIAEFKLEGL